MRIRTIATAALAAAFLGATATPSLAGDDRRPRFEKRHGAGHGYSRYRPARHYARHRPVRRHVTVKHVYKPDHTPLYALGAVAAFAGLHAILTAPRYDPPPAPAYAPLPAPAYAPPAPARFSAQAEPYCREYTREVIVNGQPAEGYGRACRQPDGSWRIVSGD